MCFEWMPSNTIMKRRNFCTKSNCLLGGGCQWEVQELNFAPSTHRLVWAVGQILPECIKHHSVLKVKLHARHQHTALTWSVCMCQQSVNQTGPMRVWTFSQTAEHHSPSPCTVVMRCPSRKRSTLERYEEGPLSTTTSFSTWNTHTKGIHPRMLPFLSSIYTTWHVTECTSILVTIGFFWRIPVMCRACKYHVLQKSGSDQILVLREMDARPGVFQYRPACKRPYSGFLNVLCW